MARRGHEPGSVGELGPSSPRAPPLTTHSGPGVSPQAPLPLRGQGDRAQGRQAPPPHPGWRFHHGTFQCDLGQVPLSSQPQSPRLRSENKDPAPEWGGAVRLHGDTLGTGLGADPALGAAKQHDLELAASPPPLPPTRADPKEASLLRGVPRSAGSGHGSGPGARPRGPDLLRWRSLR